MPKTNVEIHLKFCKSFTFPVDVKTILTDDMQIPKFLHAAGPLAGQPDLDRLVDHVEERWHLAWDRHEIKYAPPPRPPSGPSNRVDGMSFSLDFVPDAAHGYTAYDFKQSMKSNHGAPADGFLKD